MIIPRHALVLGGNGRISRHLSVILLKRSWTVTSVIRNKDQVDDLKKIADGLPGTLNILIHDLEQVDSQDKAAAIIAEAHPDSIVFGAEAGADGGEDRVIRIDRDAPIYFLRAAVATPSINHFLTISYLGCRRANAPWWTEADWEGWKKINSTFLARYYPAKLAADEAVIKEAAKRDGFVAVSVRPGGLTEKEAGGAIMGQTKVARGMTSRETVAKVLALLLESKEVKGRWLDVLDGEETIESEVERCVRDGVECAEGEEAYSG